ncbi:MAG: hypothetical protein ACK4TA_15985 [Saprospiraceae bacterium]
MNTPSPQDIHALLPILKELKPQEKLFLIQFLAAELAQQEGSTLVENLQYPVWSPYESYEAGNVLLNLLNEPPAENYE